MATKVKLIADSIVTTDQLDTASLDAHFTGGTGVTYSGGTISIGQAVHSTDSPTFADLTVTGNLNITGDINSYNVTDLDVTDKTITLGAGQIESNSGGSGIIVDGSGASILWDETNTEWDFNNSINVTGTVTADGLTVDGGASNYNTIQFTSGSTGHGTIINLGDTSDADYGSITQFATSAGEGGRMRFIAGTTETMNLRGGNVGIGTDDPGQLLHVADTTSPAFIQVGNNNGTVLYGVNAAGEAFVSGQTSSKDLIFEVNNGNNMRLHNSGKVGIGTGNNTPTGKLTIANPTAYAPNTIAAANSYIQLGSTDYGSGGSGNSDGKFMIGFGYTDGTANTHSPAYIGYEEVTTAGDTYGDLTFYTRNVITDTAPTQRMSIASDGKIDMYPSGAETTGGLRVIYDGDNNYEVARFQAQGNQDASISFVSNGTTGYYWGAGIDYSDSGSFKISNDNLLTTNNFLRIDTNGDVSFAANGTGAALIKSVSGNQTDRNAGGYPQYTFVGNEGTGMRRASSNVLAFDSSGEERMRIDSIGNLLTGPGTQTGNGDANITIREGEAFAGFDFHSARQSGNIGGTRFYNTSSNSVPKAQFLIETDGSYNFYNGTNGAVKRMKITSGGNVQIHHGNTTFYTSFEDQNEINTYTSGGANSTMYLQHPGGDLDIGAGVFTLDRANNRIKIKNSTYDSGNKPLFISNGTEGPGAVYDTVVISQDDVPCIRLDETATGQELTLSVGNENSNNAVIGSTGKITLATNRSGSTPGYQNSNGMVVIDTSRVLMNTHTEIKTTADQALTLNQNDTGGWNYIGYESQGTRKWYLGMDSNSNFQLGSDVGGATFEVSQANLRAPGVIVQTVRASVENVVGTGDFDILSVNITPKFSNSDIIVHFYTQWSVLSNNGEDWGLQLQRDGTAILGDSQNSYFINGGGVDATDYASQFTNSEYYVRTASKTDIDTGRSNGTSQITYKIRKVVPANTSTKTVRFGVDGWTGGGVESQRSLNVLMVQEVLPN